MWPPQLLSEPQYARTLEVMTTLRTRAGRHGQTLRFGYRVRIAVRETEAEARAAATLLVSRLDAADGEAIRNRSLDSTSAGVSGRPSCATPPTTTGSSKSLGIDAFILSGYPHVAECDLAAGHALPAL